MMSEKLDWTQKLGDAFLAQQKDVMDTVQKLRRKAAEAGNLKSSKEQEVKKEGDIIIVQSANPQVVYVPTYNPTVVYGTWWYPAYPPYPVYVYPPGAACSRSRWASPSALHGTDMVTMPIITGEPSISTGASTSDRSGNTETRPVPEGPGGGGKGEQWKHNPEHRQGVSYRDHGTRDKYSRQTVRPWTAVRNRGYDKPTAGTADRSGGKQPSHRREAGQKT